MKRMFVGNAPFVVAAGMFIIIGCARNHPDLARTPSGGNRGEIPAAQQQSHLDGGDAGVRFPEPTNALTLRGALALALARNPQLATHAWDIRIAEALHLKAGLRPNPAVGVEVENVLGTGSLRTAREAETTLQFSQLVELGGKRAARVRAASLSRELATWNYQVERLEVLSQTAFAFLDVLSLQERLAIADASVRLAHEATEAVRRRVEAARTFAVEGTRAEVALATMRIERDQVHRALESARLELAAQWGSTRPRFRQAEGNLEQLAAVPALESLLDRLSDNPEVARWTSELEHRAAVVSLEKSHRFPDIELGGGYRWLNGPGESALIAGFSIPLPLFNRNQGHVLQAEHEFARARDANRAAIVRANTALAQAWHRLSAAHTEVTAVRDTVLAGANEAVKTTQQYYVEGRLGHMEVLDTQKTLSAARAQYVRALTDFHKAAIEVERLIGGSLVQEATPENIDQQLQP